VGPSTLLVAADITLDDAFGVPEVETAIENASATLRARWPAVTSVYLTPVSAAGRARSIPSHEARLESRQPAGG